MSFIQYSRNQFSLQINPSFTSEISMVIPITADALLLVRTNRTYQYIGIRKNILIHKGKFPEDFTPSSYIEPLIWMRDQIVYFMDNSGLIGRLDLNRKEMVIRKNVGSERLEKDTINIINYYLIEPNAQYILVSAFNRSTLNTTIFIYDWLNNKYSNALTLNKSFNNYKIIYYIQAQKHQTTHNQIHFFVLTTGQSFKKISAISLEFSKESFKFTMVSSKETVLQNLSFVVLGGVFKNNYLYLLGNCPGQGLNFIRYNFSDNSFVRSQVLLDFQGAKTGISKKYLGIHDGNLAILFQQIPSITHTRSRKMIYTISLTKELLFGNINDKIPAHIIADKQKSTEDEDDGQFREYNNIKPSLNGFSFHKYWLPCQNIIKKCRKEGTDVQSYLFAQIIVKIPKKFFYSEMTEILGLTENFSSEILNLL